jgi:hypothetical protein
MFTVKSAYNLAFNNLIDTSQLHAHGDWSVVWSLEVPPGGKKLYLADA